MPTPKKTNLDAALASGVRPLLVSIPDAATYLGIGTTLMSQLVRLHALPKVRLGKRCLIRMDDVERLADARNSEEHGA